MKHIHKHTWKHLSSRKKSFGYRFYFMWFHFFLILYPDMTYLPSSSPITSSGCWVFPLWMVLYYIKRSISKTPPFTPSPQLSYFSNHIYYQSFSYPRSKAFTFIILSICICLMAMLNIFSCANLAFVYLLWWGVQILPLALFLLGCFLNLES